MANNLWDAWSELVTGWQPEVKTTTQLTPYAAVRFAEIEKQGFVDASGVTTAAGREWALTHVDEPAPYVYNADQIPPVRYVDELPTWYQITHPEQMNIIDGRGLKTSDQIAAINAGNAENEGIPSYALLGAGALIALAGIIALKVAVK